MKIGILSDTHLTSTTDGFRKTVETLFADVEIVIHAGDMTGISVYNYLSNWDLKAVRGNMDDFELHNLLPEKRTEIIAGRKIGIIHGRGSPQGIEDRVFGEFQGVDLIVFGHSHVPFEAKKGGVFLFNPGSFRGSYLHRGTVGIVEIGDAITFRHMQVE